MMALLRLATIILAAGQSQRMGSVNKLLMPVDGQPMIQRVVGVAIEANSTDIHVVTGHERNQVQSCLDGYDVNFVFNGSYRLGMGTSIAKGIRAIATQDYHGAMFLLGDLPYIKAATLSLVAEMFAKYEGRKILAPYYRGKPGHPVVFPREFFDELQLLSGDQGAKELRGKYRSRIARIEVDDPGTTRDMDAPQPKPD